MLISLLFLTTTKSLLTRAHRADNCPASYCESGFMMMHCSPNNPCGSRKTLPMTWYRIGVNTFPAIYSQRRYVGMNCIHCCAYRSNHPKIPG